MSRIEKILQAMIDEISYDKEPQSRIEELLLAIKNNSLYDKEPQSRIEELLLAIKNNSLYDKEPQSRIEAILLAKLNDTQYGQRPQSRIESLLLRWKGEVETHTLEGIPPLTFKSNGFNLSSYIIYGNTGGVGDKTKNLLQYPFVFDDKREMNGIVYKVNSDKSITVSGTHTGTARSYYSFSPWWTNNTYNRIPLDEGQTVTFSCKGLPDDWEMLIGFCKNQTGSFNRIIPIKYIEGENTYTYTATEDCYISFGLYQITTDSQSGFTCYPQIEVGSVATDFESPGIYKIPIICGGQTTNLYLNQPLELGEAFLSPIKIPTIDGENTLLVNTNIRPEKVYIRYTTWIDCTNNFRNRKNNVNI